MKAKTLRGEPSQGFLSQAPRNLVIVHILLARSLGSNRWNGFGGDAFQHLTV
jgi:hypothetical protein